MEDHEWDNEADRNHVQTLKGVHTFYINGPSQVMMTVIHRLVRAIPSARVEIAYACDGVTADYTEYTMEDGWPDWKWEVGEACLAIDVHAYARDVIEAVKGLHVSAVLREPIGEQYFSETGKAYGAHKCYWLKNNARKGGAL